MASAMNILTRYRDALGLMALGIAAYFIIFGNPLNDFRLMTRGVTVQGVATDVNDFEDRDDNGMVTRYFFIKYEFITDAGVTISDVVEVPGKSTDKGYKTGQSLEIQYLSGSPEVHRIKSLSSTTLSGWLIKNILFILLAIAPGCYVIYRRIRSVK
jgi:hypothetical protein